ncbi:MAG: MMPL family transporter, partial [Chloroflexi bacterium]|nr:MMPL family transporter [Chloroflexota bacterium]
MPSPALPGSGDPGAPRDLGDARDPRDPASLTAFGRLGSVAARRPWLVIGAWLLLLLLALPLAPRAPGALSAGGFSLEDLESTRARRLLEEELGLAPSAMVVLIQSETDAGAGDPAFEAAVAQALVDLPRAEHVTEVLGHQLAPRQISADRRTVYHVVALDLEPDRSPEALASVEAAIRDVPGIRTLLAGGPAFYGDIQTVSEDDLRRSELVSLPLAALALILVFGSVIAAGVPLIVGGSAVLIALALIFVVASITPMSIFVLNLATLLGLGLGVDYALLLTSRFREELALRGGGRNADGGLDRTAVDASVAATVATAGRAVFFSGLTVLLGLIGLMLFDFMILRSVGLAGAIVVGLAVVAALTLLPAVLAILGPRVDALSISALLGRVRIRPAARMRPLAAARASARPPRDGAWARLARWVMARPLRVFFPTLALLLLLGTPFLHVRFNAPDASILPSDVPSRQAFDVLVQQFGEGDFAPLQLAIRTNGPATTPENIGRLHAYSQRLQADPRVRRVDGIVDIDPRLSLEQYRLLFSQPEGVPDRFLAESVRRTTNGDLTTFAVTTPFGPNHPDARRLVADLRDPNSALAPPPGLEVGVAGGAADVADVVDRVAADFPQTALFILISTYLVLFVLLRSAILPLKALVMNTLSIVASFGALVW